MRRRILASLSLLALTAPVVAAELKPEQIAGRWTGASYSNIRSGTLTLDIVACGAGWCGIKVETGDKCGGTALKLSSGVVKENGTRFEGTLSLAAGTEPYKVHATIFPPEDGKPLAMELTGDTGGEYNPYRRSFPFESALFRVQDAVCHAPATVSALD